MNIPRKPKLDKLSKEESLTLGKRLHDEQDPGRALLYGIGSGILSVFLWALVVDFTGFIVSFYGLLVGGFVGFMVRFGGRGITSLCPAIAACVSLISCLLGNFAAVYLYLGSTMGESFLDLALLGANYVDALVWIMAAGLGGYLGRRNLSRQERFAISLYNMNSSAMNS